MLKDSFNLCTNQIVANQSNFPEEFVLNCQKVYPLLRLTQQQKERIKMAFDVCSRRVKEMNDDRDEILKVISTLSLDDSLSMLERCR